MEITKDKFFRFSIMIILCLFSFFSAFSKFLPELSLYWLILLLFENKWHIRIKNRIKANRLVKYILLLCICFTAWCFVSPFIHFLFFDAELFLEKKYLSYAFLAFLFIGTDERVFYFKKYILLSFVLASIIVAFPLLILYYKTGAVNSSLSFPLHPSLVSLKLILGLLFLIFLQYKQRKFAFAFFISIPIFLVLSVALYALQARITILIGSFLLFSFSFYIFFIYKNKTYFLLSILIAISFFMLSEHFYIRKISRNDARPQLWKSSLKVIVESKRGFCLGLGEIEGKKALNESYKANKFLPPMLKAGRFGTHNIFLTSWLKFGIVGFFLNIMIWFFGFCISIKKNNFIFFCMIVSFFSIFFVDSHHLWFTSTHYFFCFFYFLFLFEHLCVDKFLKLVNFK